MNTHPSVLLLAFTLSLADTRTSMGQAAPALPKPPPPPALGDAIEHEINAKIEHGLAGLSEAQNRIQVEVSKIDRLAQAGADFHFDDSRMEIFGWPGSSTRSLPIIISKSSTDSETINEDLQIMTRLLQKAAQGKGPGDTHAYAMGIPLFSQGSSRSSQAVYIEGHGALFLLHTPMPLKPPTTDVAPAPAAPAKPSAWEQTKRELYGPREGGIRASRDVQVKLWNVEQGRAVFDPDLVEQMKKEVIESLKNADNIRVLKPGDSITVVMSSPAAGSSKGAGPKKVGTKGKPSEDDPNEDPPASDTVRRSAAPSRLIFQTRKSDVEAYASGKLSTDQFRDKVQVWLN